MPLLFAARLRVAMLAGMALLCASHTPAIAADAEAALTLKNHRFTPEELKVPAHTRIKLMLVNEDATPEEFESHALNREKVVPGNSKATLFIGPLKPGKYPFVGEYNEATAHGVVIAE